MVERPVGAYETVSGAAAVNAFATKRRKHEKLRWLGGGAAAIGGAFLFAWSIRRAGADAVLSGVARVGAGFAVVFLLGGVRHLVRTLAWSLCLEPPHHLGVGRAFAAYLAGDSLANVTPFGFLISEPAKVVLVRDRVPPTASIAALAVENLIYSATVVVLLVAGTAALLVSFPVPGAVRAASLAILGGAIFVSAVAAWVGMTRRPVVSNVMSRLIRRNIWRRRLEAQLAHVRDVEGRIFGFVGRHRRRVLPLLGLETAFHASGVFEIWFAVRSITGTAPPVLTAFVLEYVNRTITSIFQFVPMWLGVDEAGTGLVASILHLGPAAGVSLALVRKARVIAWTAIGIALLMKQGLSIGRAVHEAEAVHE